MANYEPKEKNKDLLLEIYGGNTFCKVYQALGIGKIKFSFAEKGKEKEGIDCYVNVEDFASDFIAKIRSGAFLRRAAAEKERAAKANDKYCKDIWKSRAGVSTEQQIRAFTLQPGLKTEFVIRATMNKTSITVGFDYRELELLEYRWSFLEKDWNKKMEEKYSLANMRDESREKYYSKQVEEMEKEEADVKTEPAPTTTATQSEPEKKEKPKFVATGSTPSTPAPTDNAEAKTDAEASSGTDNVPALNLKLKVKVGMTAMKSGNTCLMAITEDGEEYAVIFPKELRHKYSDWASFESKCKSVGTIISVKGCIYKEKGRISVTEIL